MNNFKVIVSVIAIGLVASTAGCKKKEKGGTKVAGSGSGTAMVGSGSAVMTGSGSAGAMDPVGSGSDMAGSAAAPKGIVTKMAADHKWIPMDEKAGDKGPMFAVLWGDPMSGPNGFLIKVPAGSPGMHHTHTGDYHGVTIAGAPSHQPDGGKKAEPLPAPTGYWFIPGGMPHTSQCLGKEECMALVHFNDSKMDFMPAELKKDGKPDPKQVEKRAKDLKWTPIDPKAGAKGPQIAVVWGDSMSGPHGTYWKLPAGFASPPHTHTADYHAVVIEGTVMNHEPEDKAPKELGKGTYYMQPGSGPHITACKAGKDCLLYSYSLGKFDFAMAGGAAPDAGSAGSAGGGDMKGGDMKGHDGHDHGKDKKDDKKGTTK